MFPLYIREGSCIEEREKDERGRKKKKMGGKGKIFGRGYREERKERGGVLWLFLMKH